MILSALFDDRITEAIAFNPDDDCLCLDFQRDDYLALCRAIEIARFALSRYLEPPICFSERVCIETVTPVLENSIVDSAGNFAPLITVEYDPDRDD